MSDLWQVGTRANNVIFILVLLLGAILIGVFARRLGIISTVLAIMGTLSLLLTTVIDAFWVWGSDAWYELDTQTTTTLSLVSILGTTVGVVFLLAALLCARGHRGHAQPPATLHSAPPAFYPQQAQTTAHPLHQRAQEPQQPQA